MALQLVIGRSGTGKSYQLYTEIISKSVNTENTNYLIIVPEQFTLQTQKDIVSLHPNRGTMNIDILSFMRLAYRIFDEVGGGHRPVLEDTGKSMVLRKIVARKKRELELFNHDVKKQGFINELKSMISEIYQYSITIPMLEDMEKAVTHRPMLKSKLHDIIVIYQGFKEYLSENYITAEEILDVLCDVIYKSNIIANSVICLDGFTGFTPAQYKLLTILMKKAKKVIITVTMDKNEMDKKDEEFKLFHLSKKTIKKLTDIAIEENIKLEENIYIEDDSTFNIPYRYKSSPAIASLERNLFQFPSKSFDEEQDNISIHIARDGKYEVSFVVREIKRLVREEKYRYQDIAIVTGDIAMYGRSLGREFEKAGIPCFIDHKRDVLSNPLVELLRSVMDIVSNNFDYESIFRYLRCGLVDINKEDVDILENYVIALGIKGRNRWENEWTRTYRGQKEGELTRINEIRDLIYETIMPLFRILTDKSKTVRDFTTALYQFGLDLDVADKLAHFVTSFQEQNMLSTAKEYSQIYGVVVELYDKLVELLGDEIISLKEYIEVIEAGLGETKVGLIPPGLDQIVVGDIERTRLKDIKALFFVGVNDSIIPRNSGSGGILSDMERQMLSDNKLEMAPTKRQAAYTEKFYLYLNLTKPQEKLYLTYSKFGEDGKTMRPSYLIETIKKLFPKIQVIDEDQVVDDLEHILGYNGGIDYLINGLRKYPFDKTSETFMELFTYYNSKEEYKNMMRSLVEAVFYINQEKGLSKQIAKELYGNHLVGSVTRFEKYAACAFAHYLSYGLELNERQEYRLAIPDIGNLFHGAIELFSRKLTASEYTWHTIPDVIRDEWGSNCVREVADGYGNQIFNSSKRYAYMVNRVERITKRTLWAICEQIKKGDFEPVGFELHFSEKNQLNSLKFDLSKEESIRLQGRIDRLDIYEEEDKLMVGVIDYKSGNTSFDLLSVYYGLQIQLALYMNAALELMEQEHPGKEIIPAGILYYNINDPFVEKGSNIDESILKELKMNGVVNSNQQVLMHLDHNFKGEDNGMKASVKSNVIPVETGKDGLPTKRSNIADHKGFHAMEEYVKDTIYEFGRKILDGNAEITPYQMGKKQACDYCIYKSVCGFDTGIEGFGFRNLHALNKDELWQKIMSAKEKKGDKELDELDTRTTESN
jgi:ATP-dependent helicase/nuclease subunit B